MTPDGTPTHTVTQSREGVDIAIPTSGSTSGSGHLVGLSRHALEASARATFERLNGPGQWLTSLPTHSIAGFQVVARSALAGIEPVVLDGEIQDAVARMRDDVPRYLSLVPTQLSSVLQKDAGALARFDAVLVGGAALAPSLLEHAKDAGVRIVRTYGMTETSGGCVYDGVPLDGVEARLVDGRIHLSGPVLATRYLDTDEQPFVYLDGRRFVSTNDRGVWNDSRLDVLGRIDDVIISGGVNVSPTVVEHALTEVYGGTWVVVGVPDERWGQRVVAVTDQEGFELSRIREVLASLPAAYRPHGLAVMEFPLLRSGKVNRREIAVQAARQ